MKIYFVSTGTIREDVQYEKCIDNLESLPLLIQWIEKEFYFRCGKIKDCQVSKHNTIYYQYYDEITEDWNISHRCKLIESEIISI